MKDILKKAIELREHGEVREANSILVELAKNFPDNAEVNYQCAWSFAKHEKKHTKVINFKAMFKRNVDFNKNKYN
ncbi:hypothetical protein [Wukongibacter sp. M2B1]|uniref:hypothetical protein n=1 Tax=Wukongibacter sp. M2B1 TaxID=3088895 RepID=UPI003D7B62C6